MTQRDRVIQVMEKLGGFATLGKLYQEVDASSWKTKTPYESIRRIVQEKKYFFNVELGLWGLNTYKKELADLIETNQTTEKIEKLEDHYYHQGLLLEIGNVKNHQTFAPNQDKNKKFRNTTLGKVRRLQDIYSFSHKEIVKRACTIDVIWFNERKMPYAAFEVENSSDFTNALSKYIALQDFNTKFRVVANQNKEKQFKERVSRDEYKDIKDRVGFINYDKLAKWHNRSMAAKRLGKMP